MASPFPGMDHYLEHPSLWPEVHHRLISAIAIDYQNPPVPSLPVNLQLWAIDQIQNRATSDFF